MSAALFASWHHSLSVEPWEQLPGGVRVTQADDPEQIVLLLRDRDEVSAFVRALLSALALSERAPSDPQPER